jgi:hypothetical protein
MKICKCNKLYLGIIVGIIAPMITAYSLYRSTYFGEYSFPEFLQGLIAIKSMGQLISISAIPNLAVFILAVTYEKYIFGKGLVVATAVWLIVVLVFRFLV